MVLLTLLAAITIGIIRLRNLFAVVVLGGIYSFLMASVMIVLDAVDVAMQLAERVAQNAPLGVKASKKLIWAASEKPEAEFWDVQRPLMKQVWGSNDAKEGPKAFAEKRQPDWSGT